MSHKKGAYLGAVRTIEDLRSRCCVDDDTGCWHWRMCIVQGSPQVYLRHGSVGTIMRGRRAAVMLRTGKPVPKGHVAFARDICKSLDCVAPDHCISGDRTVHGQALAKSGRIKGLITKIAANRRNGRSRHNCVTTDQRAHILASTETLETLADALKLSTSTVSHIRRGMRHADHINGASVFSWRPA